jgi:hypothetical protein
MRPSLEIQSPTLPSSTTLIETPKSSSGHPSDDDLILQSIKRASIGELVDSLPSNAPVTIKLSDKSWVKSPSCIGALSCLRLAEVFASMPEVDPQAAQDLVVGLGIEKLLVNLGSMQQDKREAAGLALEQISMAGEPLFLLKLISDRALLVFAIRLSEEVEELRGCISNVIYHVCRGNSKVKLRIAEFQGGRILRTMVDILGSFTNLELMMVHTARVRDFYLSRQGLVDFALLGYVRERGLAEVLCRISQNLRSVDDPRALESLRCLTAQMSYDLEVFNDN